MEHSDLMRKWACEMEEGGAQPDVVEKTSPCGRNKGGQEGRADTIWISLKEINMRGGV